MQLSKDEFRELYNSYHSRILKLCMGYTNDHEVSQDLVQEIFIKVWQNLPGYRGDAKISTWIYRIAVNTCLAYIRKNKQTVFTGIQEDIISDERGNLEQNIQLLYKSIYQLPKTDRLLIIMVLDEIPYDEIAEILNLTNGNLRVRIHRIKNDLSKIFRAYEKL